MQEFEKIFLLGVGFTNEKQTQILEFIYAGLKKRTEKYYIVTPNPELLVLAHKDPEYKSILNNAKIALNDGAGVSLATRLMGKPMKQRITGVDFTESLCKYISDKPVTASFLGGRPHVAEKAAECLQKKYTGLKISWTNQEWDESLAGKKTDILFVAFGSPKQEKWIANNLEKINAKVVIGVGGTFDFISGSVPRAPKIFRSLGMEWLFRLLLQPWRIKRQLSLISFIILVIKERFGVLK